MQFLQVQSWSFTARLCQIDFVEVCMCIQSSKLSSTRLPANRASVRASEGLPVLWIPRLSLLGWGIHFKPPLPENPAKSRGETSEPLLRVGVMDVLKGNLQTWCNRGFLERLFLVSFWLVPEPTRSLPFRMVPVPHGLKEEPIEEHISTGWLPSCGIIDTAKMYLKSG